MYEILYMPDIPNAAAINAAVELTKQYEPQEVAAFVNGILGSFVRAGVSGHAGPSRRRRRPGLRLRRRSDRAGLGTGHQQLHHLLRRV